MKTTKAVLNTSEFSQNPKPETFKVHEQNRPETKWKTKF